MPANKLNLPKFKTLETDCEDLNTTLVDVKKAFGKRMPKGVAKAITQFNKIVTWIGTAESTYTEVLESISGKPKTKAARA